MLRGLQKALSRQAYVSGSESYMRIVSLLRSLLARFDAPPAVVPRAGVEAPAANPWASPQFHVQQLAAEVCLCGAAKRVGSYKCLGCRTVA